MPASVSRELGPNDSCAPGGAVISAILCAVVEGEAVVGWTESSGFIVREVGVDGTVAPVDCTPAALALEARNLDASAAAAGAVWDQFVNRGASHSGTKGRQSFRSIMRRIKCGASSAPPA